jgi:aromatic ring-cleaving dioxygenase
MASAVYQMHEQVPTSSQPTVSEALFNHKNGVKNYGYERRFGKYDTTPLYKFEEPVQSWDVHVYFNSESEEETIFALNLRFESLHKFPNLTVNRPYSYPIGPHPTAMFSCELHTPTQMSQYLSWFCTRRGKLSALVHPNTGNPYL